MIGFEIKAYDNKGFSWDRYVVSEGRTWFKQVLSESAPDEARSYGELQEKLVDSIDARMDSLTSILVGQTKNIDSTFNVVVEIDGRIAFTLYFAGGRHGGLRGAAQLIRHSQVAQLNHRVVATLARIIIDYHTQKPEGRTLKVEIQR